MLVTGSRRIISFLLAMLLVVGCVQYASAAKVKKDSGLEVDGLNDFFDNWYYTPASLPEGAELITNEQSLNVYVSDNSKDKGSSEVPTLYKAVFRRGETELRGAVAFRQQEGSLVMYIDNSKLVKPGTAVFHIILETESFHYEKDMTLCVLDYNVHPLLEKRLDEVTINAEVGSSYLDSEFLEMVANVHDEKIISFLKGQVPGYSSRYAVRKALDVDLPAIAEYSGAVKRESVPDPSRIIYRTAVNDFGVFPCTLHYTVGNAGFSFPITVQTFGYKISGPGALHAGDKAQYSLRTNLKDAAYTWSVEGRGAEIDSATGLLTVAADISNQSAVRVKATMDNGDVASRTVFIGGGLLNTIEWKLFERDGFSIPLPSNSDWHWQTYTDSTVYRAENDDKTLQIEASVSVPNVPLVDTDQEADTAYNAISLKSAKNAEKTDIRIDGHLARLWTLEYYENGVFSAYQGIILYARNDRMLEMRIYSRGQGGTPENAMHIEMDDLIATAQVIVYKESKASYTKNDASIVVTERNESTSVTAGKRLQFSAAFANTELVNTKAKNDDIIWSVTPAGYATIDNKGKLIVNSKLEAPVTLEIKATSKSFGTEATYQVTALPTVKRLTVSPAEITLYVGSDMTATAKAVIEPATLPQNGIIWKAGKEWIVRVEFDDNGEAILIPNKRYASMSSVTAKEPSGHTARLMVHVVQPVTEVQLKQVGKARPGATVTIEATLLPKKAANKKVTWEIDVDESVATISKGTLRIARTAPVGTVITVTCTALGAAEPVPGTIEITVVEK